MVLLNNNWDIYLEEEFQKEAYLRLREFLKMEYKSRTIFPNMYDIFNALKYTDYQEVRVVILGQDPYHGVGQAHGLSFSVLPGVNTPPSLLNIYKELAEDCGCTIPNNGYLKSWADQGVLLLNTALTVQKDVANSHRGKGWEVFTDTIISKLNDRKEPMIFLLWGNNAREKVKLITNRQHYILQAPHPSPLSAHRGFLGCKHFSMANAKLEEWGQTKINWQVENI